MAMRPIIEQFQRDADGMTLSVELDQGVHRCLRFSRPDTNIHAFRLITWPGGLSITGDMGTYSFSRLEDMFQFFRSRNDDLAISVDYWHQKLISEDDQEPAMVFSREKFSAIVREETETLLEDETDPEVKEAVQKAVYTDLIEPCFDHEFEAMRAAIEFSFETQDGQVFDFSDFWEYNLKAPSNRFLWCLYAIVWGIAQFDAYKLEAAA